MTQDEIIKVVAGLPDVDVLTAGPDNGAPESAWGDTFFSTAGGDPTRQLPFATLVVSDYEGFDMASDLNRPGVFRLNICVGRRVFEDLFGYGPQAHAAHAADHDYAEFDRLIPHPIYAAQGWVSIVNPGDRTAERARALLIAARERDAARLRR